MNLKSVTIDLDPIEIQDVLAIGLDEDRHRALDFIKQVLVKKVEQRLRRH